MAPSGTDTGADGAGEDTDASTDGETDTVDDETVVQTAAEAAETVIFSRYDNSEVSDFDVTVTYEEYQLSVEVYLDAPDDTHDPEQVTDDAVLAARGAVDDLLL